MTKKQSKPKTDFIELRIRVPRVPVPGASQATADDVRRAVVAAIAARLRIEVDQVKAQFI